MLSALAKYHRRVGTSLRFALFFGAAFLWFACSGEDADGKVLATVGERQIRENVFVDEYQQFLMRTGATDNGLARRSLLKNFVSNALLINEAYHRGYDSDETGRREIDRIRVQELLDAYYRKYVVAPAKIEEADLQRLYIWANTRLKVRHLYAADQAGAESLYARLQKGESFETLARGVFEDPSLRDSGGLLGYFSLDELDPAFEEAAYGLQVGEVSHPVRTADGYSIIRVDDRIVKPLLTETEYAQSRPRLERFWRRRLTKLGGRHLVDSLAQQLEIRFEAQTLADLYRAFRELPGHGEEEGLASAIPVGPEDRPLLHSTAGTWTVATFRDKVRFTSPQQHRWIRSEGRFKDFISGLVVREHILSNARREGMDRTADYEAQVEEAVDKWLLERIEDTLYREFEIPEDSLMAFYEANRESMVSPPQMRLQEIVVENNQKADQIAARLRRGEAFGSLAREFSVRAFSAERDGELGWVTRAEMGSQADAVFALSRGKWIGPIAENERYFFFKCLDILPSRLLSFQEARPGIEANLRALTWKNRMRTEKVDQIRQRVPVASWPRKLRDVKLN